MAKVFPAHHLKAHRIYDVWEVAEALGCHRQTVLRWIKHGGLRAETAKKPWLIEGSDLKEFLGARRRKATCKLALHHCYCLGCKAPRSPDGKIADYTQITPETGRLTGLCPACGALIHKIIKRADLPPIEAKIEVTFQQVSPRLVSLPAPHLNASLRYEGRTDGKAQ